MKLARPGFFRDLVIVTFILLFGLGVISGLGYWLSMQFTESSEIPRWPGLLLDAGWVGLVCGLFGVYDEKVRHRQCHGQE